MANRGRHRKRHVKCVIHMSMYHTSWISKVLDDETITKILHHQQKQSGIRDLTVFEKWPSAGASQRGFTWKYTLEGHRYWDNIMNTITTYKYSNKL